MIRLPFLRGFLRALVGLPDSSRGYVMRMLRAELQRCAGGPPAADFEYLVAALAPR